MKMEEIVCDCIYSFVESCSTTFIIDNFVKNIVMETYYQIFIFHIKYEFSFSFVLLIFIMLCSSYLYDIEIN